MQKLIFPQRFSLSFFGNIRADPLGKTGLCEDRIGFPGGNKYKTRAIELKALKPEIWKSCSLFNFKISYDYQGTETEKMTCLKNWE